MTNIQTSTTQTAPHIKLEWITTPTKRTPNILPIKSREQENSFQNFVFDARHLDVGAGQLQSEIKLTASDLVTI